MFFLLKNFADFKRLLFKSIGLDVKDVIAEFKCELKISDYYPS